MARVRTAVSRPQKRALFREAGQKCANPGCSGWRTHIHHIMEWAVYETHDSTQMVAVCPTCHDAIHHGPLVIDDETIRQWKEMARSGPPRDHVYVEPGSRTLLLLGSIAVCNDEGVTVFDLGDNLSLGFRTVDEDVMLVNLALQDAAGAEVLRIRDGHVRIGPAAGFSYRKVPGRAAVFVDDWLRVCPDWVIDLMRVHEPGFASAPDTPFFEVHVLEPGLVRVRGIWVRDERGVVITDERLAFVSPSLIQPLSLVGEGKDSVLKFTGPLTSTLFGY